MTSARLAPAELFPATAGREPQVRLWDKVLGRSRCWAGQMICSGTARAGTSLPQPASLSASLPAPRPARARTQPGRGAA